MSSLILPKIETCSNYYPQSNKKLVQAKTIYNNKKNSFNFEKNFNKTFKYSFKNPIKNESNENSPEDFKNINFIKNQVIDEEIQRLHDRHINDQIFTNAVKNFSFEKKNTGLIRGVNKKKTIYGINYQFEKESKRDIFILKNYFPIYIPNLIFKNKNLKNKHYSKSILKNLNNKLFSKVTEESMKSGLTLDLDSYNKKFEEEVKQYQLSKIGQLNNLMQSNDNIITINNLEELEKNNLKQNLGYGQLFYIRENNFNENEINQKLEDDKLKIDLEKEKHKFKDLFSNIKTINKKRNKHTYNLFNKNDIKKAKSKDIYNEGEEIANYELNIYYFQNLSVSSKNKEGVEGINQDSFIELLSINGNKKFHLFGVMDGHGINGHIISKYISSFIREYFISEKIKILLNKCKNIDEIYHLLTNKKYSFINNLIYECNDSLINNANYDCNLSGSTCLLIFIIGNNLICSNIGNSRAILLEKTELLQLSLDQTLNDPEELKRILKNGGKVKKIKNKVVLKNIGNYNYKISRSIGDKSLKNIGIIYQPVITEYVLSKNSRFLILGTQGLWKVLSNKKAAIQVNKSIKLNNPLDCCRLLIKKAEDILKKNSCSRDDITIITIIFEEINNNYIKNDVYE